MPDVRRRYHIRAVLGRGAFGKVYLADQEAGGLTTQVALKVLHPDLASESDIARFRDEARMLAAVRHRALIQVQAMVPLDEGRWAMVMEYVPGTNLSRLRREVGPLPISAALELVREVSSALAAVVTDRSGARVELVHRDLKPANLQLTSEGEVKVLDFGIAKAQMTLEAKTADSSVMGTLRYMAPERFAGRTRPPSDIYALAIVFLSLVHRQPEVRVGMMPRDQRASLFDDACEYLTRLKGCPPGVDELIRSMLAEDPMARPSAARVAERADDLMRQAEGPSLRAFASRTVPKVPPDDTGPRDAWVGTTILEWIDTPRAPARHRFRRWIVALTALLVLVSAGAFATSVMGSGAGVLWWVERGRAKAHEQEAIEASEEAVRLTAQLLLERARRGLAAGDVISARAYAVASLQRAESPEARGVLWATWSAASPTLVGSVRLPQRCDAIVRADDRSDDLFCYGAGTLARLGLDGSIRWTVPLERKEWFGPSLHLGTDGSLWLAAGESIATFDPDSGEQRTTIPAPRMRDLTHVDEVPWWTDGKDVFHLGPDGEVVEHTLRSAGILGALVSSPETDEPLALRASGRLERLDGERLIDFGTVAHDALLLDDGGLWVFGASTWMRPEASEPLQLVGLEGETTTDGLALDEWVAAATLDGSVRIFPRDATDHTIRIPGPSDAAAAVVAVEPHRSQIWLVHDDALHVFSLTDVSGVPISSRAGRWVEGAMDPAGERRLSCAADGRWRLQRGISVEEGVVETGQKVTFCGFIDGEPVGIWRDPHSLARGTTHRPDLDSFANDTWDHGGRSLVRISEDYRWRDQALGHVVEWTAGDRIATSSFGDEDRIYRIWRWTDDDRYELVEERRTGFDVMGTLPDGTDVTYQGELVGQDRHLGSGDRRFVLVRRVGEHLVAGSRSGHLTLWDAETLELRAEVDLGGGRIGSIRPLDDPAELEISTFDGRIHHLSYRGIFASAPELADQLHQRTGVQVVGAEAHLVAP